MKAVRLLATIAVFAVGGCGVYTFSGSTLPGHIKTVDIPLFANQSLMPDVADGISSELTRRVLGGNVLKIVSRNGDATINGTVRSYDNREYFYSINQPRTADVSDYAVTVVVDVDFVDNKSGQSIYKGAITGRGVYKVATEKESDGRQRAMTDVVDQIMQNSVQGW
jgi:hypothetical protein